MRYIVDDDQFTIEPLSTDKRAGESISWFGDAGFALLSRWWTQASWQRRYSYQFSWLGRPIIQLPADVMMMQEIIWRTKPTVIVETGIAHGGSVVLHASLLKLTHDAQTQVPRPHVIAIDVEIRAANRASLESHPLRSMYTLIEGSSISASTIDRVRALLRPDDRVMVVLDSNHTRDHVATELRMYAPLVSSGCGLVVMDGIMPDLARLPGGRPEWQFDHPGPAVDEFLRTELGREFSIDSGFVGYAVTHSPRGVLMRREEPAP